MGDAKALKTNTGGAAAAGGFGFQADVGAIIASHAIAMEPLSTDWGAPSFIIARVGFETTAPVDDLLLVSNDGRRLFVQAKTKVDLSVNPASALAASLDQAVRLWIAASNTTDAPAWLGDCAPSDLRIAIAVTTDSPATIRIDLQNVLRKSADVASLDELTSRLVNEREQRAFTTVRDHLARALAGEGGAADDDQIFSTLRLIRIVPLAASEGGADRRAAHSRLTTLLEDPTQSGAAYETLAAKALDLMAQRGHAGLDAWKRAFTENGVGFRASASYAADVQALAQYSARVLERLSAQESIECGGVTARVPRACTGEIASAAKAGNLLIIGEPGAGKSGALAAAASTLRDAGGVVVVIAVDQISATDLGGLRDDFGLKHPVVDVLENVPVKAGGAYLLIDALDASRGGPTENAVAVLIQATMQRLPHWRVVATVREFDLKLGKRYQNLFAGPPVGDAPAKDFAKVRHVRVPTWSDNELAELLKQAPALAPAFSVSTDALKDVLRIPFNTRLAAELIDAGLAPEKLRTVSGQTDLLDMYWRERIDPLGVAPHAALRGALTYMASNQTLRAPSHVLAGMPDHEALFSQHLLVQIGEHGLHVAFRHHLLFDYAASRFLVDPEEIAEFKDWLSRKRQAGLLLSPALSFTLDALWRRSGTGRSKFWEIALPCSGDPDIDPAARAAFSRVAALSPSEDGDVGGLQNLIASQAAGEPEQKAIAGLASAVITLAPAEHCTSPWLHVARSLIAADTSYLSAARALVMWALERTPNESPLLGAAARELFAAALKHDIPSRFLVVPAIEAVVRTFSTDPDASRTLLGALIEPQRMDVRAHEEFPWLARQVDRFVAVDPDFAVRIYRIAFEFDVSSKAQTPLGDSQILALSSTARQDYQLARHFLTEAFPAFLRDNPAAATSALIGAIDAYVRREHPIPSGAQSFELSIGGQLARLQEDLSYIWASDPNDPHPDDGEKLLQHFVRLMQQCPDHVAVQVVQCAIPQLCIAVLWARLFMVAVERHELLGPLLYPAASQPAFLHASETKKDAIDLVGVMVATTHPSDEAALFAEIEAHNYDRYAHPEDVKAGMSRRLRAAIDRHGVRPDETSAPLSEISAATDPNARLRTQTRAIWTGNGGDDFWWLRSEGVDTQTPPHEHLLAAGKALADDLTSIGDTLDDAALARLLTAIAATDAVRAALETEAALRVLGYVDDALARAAKLILEADGAEHWTQGRAVARGIALRVSESPDPGTESDAEADFEKHQGWSSPAARIEAASAVAAAAKFNDTFDEPMRDAFVRLLSDPHPAIRQHIATRLNTLWDTDRDLMWKLANEVASTETNRGVLQAYGQFFLNHVCYWAPREVDAIVTALYEREELLASSHDGLRGTLAQLSTVLAVRHSSDAATQRINLWIEDLDTHTDDVSDIVETLRGAFVVGLADNNSASAGVRGRAIPIARQVLAATSKRLNEFLADAKPERQDMAKACAKLIDQICMQLLFDCSPGSGNNRRLTIPALAFLNECEDLLQLIAASGTPHTTHHLLELLDLLIDEAPERTWSLIAEAILVGGKTHGYSAESMGADLVVSIVGRYLADHKTLFTNDAMRRGQLVEILEIFLQVGWGSARRLLTDLPELLR